MKNDLICQSSEYDCGPTSVTNAIRFLFEREEILPGLLKHIWLMGIDTYCDQGHVGCRGTSKSSMRYMADWFNAYGESMKFPIGAEFLEMEAARVVPGEKAWQCLEKGGCAVMRCVTGGIPHYVLLTALLPDDEIGLFDPYDEEPVFQEPGRRVILGKSKQYNRAVRREFINAEDESDYAMGKTECREMLLLWKKAEGGENGKP